MKDKEALFARYPDLLDAQADAETLALIQQLDSAYAAPEPPAHLMMAAALKSEAQSARPQRRKSIIPWPRPVHWLPRRVSTVVVAIVLAVALMGSALAYPLIKQLIDPDPGLHQVVNNPLLYQDVNASQAAGGFTLTVQKAYADANRVILGYTVTKESNPQAKVSYQTTLTTQEGVSLRARGWWETNRGEPILTWFDAASITGNPEQLHLHLKVDGLIYQTSSPPPNWQDVVTQPLAVDFSVPFHPGRMANLHQAVTVHGKTLILERVVVTPSGTRLYLRGEGYPLALYGLPSLGVGKWTSDQLTGAVIEVWPTDDQVPTNAMVAVNFDTSLVDQHGEWTLTIPQLGNPGPSTKGPWVFHFTVP